MRIDILTTFVNMFSGPFEESIVKRAAESGIVDIRVRNLRDWARGVHRKTDDEQYGGGEGMVMLAEPLIEAVGDLLADGPGNAKILVTTPQGDVFNQDRAESLAREEHLIIVCGHYKGIDERVMTHFRPEEISIGDYILTGGELPAMVIVDAVARLLPGAVNSFSSVEEDSFTSGLLDCPRYTRPREVRGMEVPSVLMGGNHARIEAWRRREALERTAARRPGLVLEHWRKRLASAAEKTPQ